MLSQNLNRNKNFSVRKSRKKKYVISAVLVISLFFIGYGFYVFSKLNEEGQKADAVKIETGDRPLKQNTVIYVKNADGGLSLRETPDKNSKRLARIPNNTKLESTEELNGWYKVTYQGKVGWISQEFTTTEAPPKDAATGWSYYLDAKNGYKLKYPVGWKYQDYGASTASATLSMIAFSAQELPATIPANSDFIAPVTVAVSSKTLADANKGFSTISGVVITPVKVGLTISATKYTYTSVSSNTQMTAIVFSAAGKTFIMNEGGGYAEDLLKMANTFSMGI